MSMSILDSAKGYIHSVATEPLQSMRGCGYKERPALPSIAGIRVHTAHLPRPPPSPVQSSGGCHFMQLLVPAQHASATTAFAANTASGRDASVDSKRILVPAASHAVDRPPMLYGTERAPRRIGWSSWKILKRSSLAPRLFQRRGEDSPSTTRGPTRAAAALTQPSRRQNETKQSTTEESFWKPAQIRAFFDGTFPGNSEMLNPRRVEGQKNLLASLDGCEGMTSVTAWRKTMGGREREDEKSCCLDTVVFSRCNADCWRTLGPLALQPGPAPQNILAPDGGHDWSTSWGTGALAERFGSPLFV
ncbi:hypothetical protein CPLU01_01292 [Colletotrichum plurivorum]|uniref:Uncharacterized protein n=1 Tax=Colletotrichum plurivorum TaxID=2175906 RepID=A0A8H6U358_9PEZI|nr:hypothetical protein CPLU01_01292 [Colletotrichum plurivorum]